MKSALLILALAVSPAMAQEWTVDNNPLNNRSNYVARWKDVAISTGVLATITKEGDVKIDWDAVEKAVNNPDTTDAHTLAIARLMIAIVYGTWKPMK